MSFWRNLFGGAAKTPAAPRNSSQGSGGGMVIQTAQQLEEALRGGAISASGTVVTPNTAMRVAAVFACVRIRTGVVANMPLHIKRRVSDKVREDASDHPLWRLLRRKPNRWQTASQFKRMLHAHVILRGNAYALIVRSRGQVIELVPLHPDRVEAKQKDDLTVEYVYTRKNGGQVRLKQSEVFHLVGLTLDGVTGVSALTFARETIGESMAMADHGATMFRNGARVSGMLKHPGKLGEEGREFIKGSLEEFRSGGERDGKVMILEEGMDYRQVSLSAVDAQWIESRRFSRTDICMFFGVPPHMVGDTEKSTSFGTGLEQQTQGFITFGAEDDLTTWEQTIDRDLLAEEEQDLYARFNRNALVRGDLKARWEAYVKARQWGVMSADEIRELEDMNPRPDGRGGEYAEPPNTAGKSSEERDDDTSKTA
ncbi:MAG: phage portal protein [Thermaurantiacus sp.]